MSDENTYERQAGLRQRKEQVDRGSGDDTGTDTQSSWSDASEVEEDLFPDVTLPATDDIVCITAAALPTYVPKWCVDVDEKTREQPKILSGFRVGLVQHPGDYGDDEVPIDHIAVEFIIIDDRVANTAERSIEYVHRSQLQIIDRPFTVSERVVCNGKTGVVDEVDIDMGVKPVTLPPTVRVGLPESIAEQLHFATEEATEAAARANDTDKHSAFSGVKKLFRKKHHAKAKPAAGRPTDRVPLEQFERELDYVGNETVLPLHPFRLEACVVNKVSLLVGMVVQVDEVAVVSFDDGVIAVVQDINSCDLDRRDCPWNNGVDPVVPTRRVRFAYDNVQVKLLVGEWGDEEERVGVITAVLPINVSCLYTGDNGLTWDIGPVWSHPADLSVLDYYYTEFPSIGHFVFRLDPVMRECVREEISRRCTEAGVDPSPLEEEFEMRDLDYEERRRKLAESPQELIDKIGDWDIPVDKQHSTATPNPAILRHAMRCSSRDVASHCGTLTPLEFNVFYEALYPPRVDWLTDEGFTFAEWMRALGTFVRLLPNLVQIRLMRTRVTVVWDNGDVDYRRDSKEMLLRTAPEADTACVPLHLVGPSVVRSASFPIAMGVIDEEVGEFDIEFLPLEHFTAGAGDIVLYKCKDDFDRDREQGPAHEPPRVIGRVLGTNPAEKTVTVRWMPVDNAVHPDLTDRASFPDHSEPDMTNPLTKAVAAAMPLFGQVRVGAVTRLMTDGTATVSWWDLQEEVIYQPRLSVVQFSAIDDLDMQHEEHGSEEEPEEEGATNDTAAATPAEGEEAPAKMSPVEVAKNMGAMLTGAVRNFASLFKRKPNEAGEEDGAGADGEAAPAVAHADPNADLATAEATDAASSPSTPVSEAPVAAAPSRGVFIITETDFAADIATPTDGTSTTPAEPTRYMKRIQAEWKLLQRDVPEGVIVKVSESQMHLMKIFVRGPMHTPYFQGAYLFDVFFPPAFPSVAPVVKFHAYNIRMNPNLYENGYVCLSLLGTWQGRQTSEEWNPVTSNVLQLIFALQAMILCKEPYYNEPGYEESMGTERGLAASRAANEQYYLYKMGHFFKQCGSPPPDWVEEVRAHAATYSPKLVARGRSYLAADAAPPATAASAPAAAAATAAPSESGNGGGSAAQAAGLINIDGLVLPISKSLRMSLPRALDVLERHLAKESTGAA